METSISFSYLDSPLGRLLMTAEGTLLTGLYMPGHKGGISPAVGWRQTDEPFAVVRGQLTEYFAGQRQVFDVPLKLRGTPFQQRVWQELVRIPYGTTITYAQLAQRVGKPTAFRAVGSANARNPISIIVPCHRVIGADGKLAGYAGGVDKKQWLLAWERGATTAERGSYLFDVEGASRETSTTRRSPSIVARSGRS